MTEWKPFWQPKSAVSSQSVKVAEVVDRAPAAVFCEFATGIISEGYENRTCSITNWSFCSAKVFKDPKIFEQCSARKEKLAVEQT